MEKLFKKRTNLLKTVGGITILLALCISMGKTGITSGNTTQERPIGGTLILEQVEDITHLFQPIEPGGAWYVDFSLFDRLVEVDADTCEVVPGLAKSWDISPDGLTYTFHLYENVKWHDGVKFTSTDVKYTYDYNMENNMPGKGFLAPMESVETPDDNTVVIHLSEPNAAFASQLGTWAMYLSIVPKHIYDVGIPWEENPNIYEPIGTGPFKFAELRPGEFAKQVRYDEYHKGRPYLDTVVWQIIPEVAVAIQMLKTNEIQVIGCSSVPSFTEMDALAKIRGITVRGSPLGGEDLWALEFNGANPDLPYKDVQVRRAICHALNRPELVEKVFRGYVEMSESIFTKDIPWAYNTEVKCPEYNPTEAEKLLDEAGYPRGTDGIRFKAKLEFPNYFASQHQGLAAVISEQLAAVGIELEYTMYEWLQWYNKVKMEKDFELSLYVQYASPDPDRVREQAYTGETDNGGQYSNPRVDELFDLARAKTNKDERAQYYFEIQEILAEDLPFIPLADQDFWYGVRDDYHDFWFDEGFEATKLNPWTVWWEGGTIPIETITQVTTAVTTALVVLFPTKAVAALAAIVPGLIAVMLALRRRRHR